MSSDDEASQPVVSEPAPSDPSTKASDPSTKASEPTERRKPGRGRRMLVALLVILGCVLAPLSLIAVWTRNTLLNTDNYVSTVAPLATNQDVIDAVATRLTARILEVTDVKARLTDAIPPRAKAAAPALTAALQGVVHDATVKVLSSDQFGNIWEQANRRAHAQIVEALTGSGSGKVKIQNGEVTLDLSAAAKKVKTRINSLGLDLSSKLPQGQIDPKIVLFQSEYLAWAQQGIDLLQNLAWVLPVLMLLCFAAAIALSRNRRRTVLRSGLGLSIGMLLVLTALNLGRTPYLGLFPRAEGKQAGGAAYDQILHTLILEARVIFAIGLVIAFAAWLAGPSPSATRLRGVFSGRERTGEPGPFATWVGHSKVGLRIATIALGAIALVAVDQPTGLTVLVIAIAVLVILGIIELVGRPRPAASSASG